VRHLPHPTITQVARLFVVTAAILVACTRDENPNAPGPATVVADSLEFSRADSTVVEMGTTPLVCCGLYDPSFVNERAIRIVLYDPANQKPGWQILILLDRAQAGAITTLPTTPVAPSKVPYVSMFAADIGNELSSDVEESSGTITVHSFSCGSTTIEIDFSVDAILGSEFGDGPAMAVKGTFRATFPKNSCP
jgi:hypothetical protein